MQVASKVGASLATLTTTTCLEVVMATRNSSKVPVAQQSLFRRCNYPSEYNSWARMRERCTSEKHLNYKRYGGRGIVVCKRWELFSTFMMDMGPKPSPKYTIDRIDPDGNYTPRNCRWATMAEQLARRRPQGHGRVISFNGETLKISEWAQRIGLTYISLYRRLKKYPVEAALTNKKFYMPRRRPDCTLHSPVPC